MDNRTKNIVYSAVLFLLMGAVYLYRDYQKKNPTHFYVQGTTMGVVPYNVKYIDPEGHQLDGEIKQLLKDFNQSLSTYIPSSEISRFNQGNELTFESDYFYPVLKVSEHIYETTNGAFDPSIMPLVKAWGFGPGKEPTIEEGQIDSLLALVEFKAIQFDSIKVWKQKEGVQLDFSAIAKGYAVDRVGELLETYQIENYMVEIGGEVLCKGYNEKDTPWRIGIDNPLQEEEGQNKISAIISLSGKAMATSGNYRNYYMKDGKKYAHTISPKTGYPVQHSLLSASVLANHCIDADAYATAFMVLGVDESKKILQKQPDIEAMLIYEEQGEIKIYTTKLMSELISN